MSASFWLASDLDRSQKAPVLSMTMQFLGICLHSALQAPGITNFDACRHTLCTTFRIVLSNVRLTVSNPAKSCTNIDAGISTSLVSLFVSLLLHSITSQHHGQTWLAATSLCLVLMGQARRARTHRTPTCLTTAQASKDHRTSNRRGVL